MKTKRVVINILPLFAGNFVLMPLCFPLWNRKTDSISSGGVEDLSIFLEELDNLMLLFEGVELSFLFFGGA